MGGGIRFGASSTSNVGCGMKAVENLQQAEVIRIF
jgi:hypothetical protein